MPVVKLTPAHLAALDIAAAYGRSGAEIREKLAEGIEGAPDSNGSCAVLAPVEMSRTRIRELVRNRKDSISEVRRDIWGTVLASEPLAHLGGRMAAYSELYQFAKDQMARSGRVGAEGSRQALKILQAIGAELGRFEPSGGRASPATVHVESGALLNVVSARLGELIAASAVEILPTNGQSKELPIQNVIEEGK